MKELLITKTHIKMISIKLTTNSNNKFISVVQHNLSTYYKLIKSHHNNSYSYSQKEHQPLVSKIIMYLTKCSNKLYKKLNHVINKD